MYADCASRINFTVYEYSNGSESRLSVDWMVYGWGTGYPRREPRYPCKAYSIPLLLQAPNNTAAHCLSRCIALDVACKCYRDTHGRGRWISHFARFKSSGCCIGCAHNCSITSTLHPSVNKWTARMGRVKSLKIHLIHQLHDFVSYEPISQLALQSPAQGPRCSPSLAFP